jgi:hypothetical protein
MVQNPGKEMSLLQKLSERGVSRLIPLGLKKKGEDHIIKVIEAMGSGNMKFKQVVRWLREHEVGDYEFATINTAFVIATFIVFPLPIVIGLFLHYFFDALGISVSGVLC